jgi:hypothetical protein
MTDSEFIDRFRDYVRVQKLYIAGNKDSYSSMLKKWKSMIRDFDETYGLDRPYDEQELKEWLGEE